MRKYDSGGNELWSRTALEGRVVDATGIYVVGTMGPGALEFALTLTVQVRLARLFCAQI